MVKTIETSTRTIVAIGLPSVRMPGISPGRRRLSDGGDGRRRRCLGGFGVPPLSSFGARLRSRFPQYGHSVMYGLTCSPQVLHTTNRSGGPATRTSLSVAGEL